MRLTVWGGTWMDYFFGLDDSIVDAAGQMGLLLF